MIFHRNLLHAEIFFPGNRKPCTGFYGLIIGEDDALSAAHITDTRNCSAGRAASIFFIHFITGKSTDFKKSVSLSSKVIDSFPGRQFIFFMLFFNCILFHPLSSISGKRLRSWLEGLLHVIFILVKIKIHEMMYNLQYRMDALIICIFKGMHWKRIRPWLVLADHCTS